MGINIKDEKIGAIERASNIKCTECGYVLRANGGFYFEFLGKTAVRYYCGDCELVIRKMYDIRIIEFDDYSVSRIIKFDE